MIYKSILDTIGKTPMIDVTDSFENLQARVLVKVESFNPGGSVKDRIAYAMIQQAIIDKKIDASTEVIEPTSGNTGIGLAMVCAALNIKCTLVMPDTMTVERRKLIQAFGAHLVLTDGAMGMKGSIAKAQELAEASSNAFIPMQFENPANPAIHKKTTALEILDDTEGELDVFVAGSGTGGTLSGVGSVLKERVPHVKIIAVEPEGSPIISQNVAGKHGIYGIGPGFVPKNLNVDILDEVHIITDQRAKEYTHLLAQRCGILAGISSGAAFAIALDFAKDVAYQGKTIVVVLPDTGERYLSSHVFKEGE